MSTIFKSQRKDITGTNLTQTRSYNEGDVSLLLNTITFDNEKDYTDVLTLTIDVGGTGDPALFTIESNSEVAPIVQTDADTWTITSQYIKNNYTQNVHADFASTIASLKMVFNNNDTHDNYVLTLTLSDGHSSTGGAITVTGNSVVDAVNIVQNLTVAEDQFIYQLGLTSGLYPQITDLNEAGKTYRITLTGPLDKCAFYALLAGAPTITTTTAAITDTIILEGTQQEINSVISADNLYFFQAPDNTDPYTITWTQEVISGANGAPYVQETGQFNFTISTVDSADTAVDTIYYSEDIETSGVIATINDTRDYSGIPYDTRLNATATFANSAAVDSVFGWTNAGGGVFTYSNKTRTDMISTLQNFKITPPADYDGDTQMTLLVTRDGIAGDATWWSTGWNTQTTLINKVIDFTNLVKHDEFAITATQTYSEDITTNWTIGTFGDLAVGKTYKLTLTFSDPAAIDGVSGYTEISSGVYELASVPKSSMLTMLSNVNVTPAADYTGNFTFTYNQYQETDLIDQGTSSAVSVTNAGTHNEYNINTGVIVNDAEDASPVLLNIGSVTDLAVGKTYTITLTMDVLYAGSFPAPWATTVPGEYTFTGTKAQCNAELAAVTFNIRVDFIGTVIVDYHQNQDTDTIDQGTVANIVTVNVTSTVDATNIVQAGLAMVEDEYSWTFATPPQIADQAGAGSGKTYRVTMSPNAGTASADDVYSMWTNSAYAVGGTYGSTLVFEGTQAQINTAITSNWHLDKTTADNSYNFKIKWTQEVIAGAVLAPYIQEVGLFTFDVTADVDAGYTVQTAYHNWNVDQAELLENFAAITDTRGDQADASTILYRTLITLDTPLTSANGTLSSAGAGGTTVWDGPSVTLTIEGNKTQVNSHLAAVTWTGANGFRNAFTMTTELLRNINSAGWLTHKTVLNKLMNSGNGVVGESTLWYYDEDEWTKFNDPTKLV